MLANRKRLPSLALWLAVGLAPGAALANDWPQLGLDGARGRASSEVSGAPFQPAWQAPVGSGPIVASPTVADGYVVVAGAGGMLGVLHALDGTSAWTTTVAGGIAASPAIDRGRVFVPTLSGKLQALSLSAGQSVWQRAFGGFNYGSPAVVDGTLIIATGFPGQSVVRVAGATGATLWESPADAITNIVGSSPAIAGSRVLLGVNGGRYQSLDLNTGTAGWHVDTVGAVGLSAPLVIGGNAYLLPGGGQAALYAADATSGTTLASWPVTAADPAAPGGATTANRVAVSSPVALGTLIAFQARFEYDVKADADGAPGQHVLNEYLIAVDPISISVAWVRPTGQRTVASINEVPGLGLSPTPVVFATGGAPAAVVASSVAPTISAFDAAGNPLWSAPLSAPTRSSPVLANGLLLVATDAGQVHAFRSDVNGAPIAPADGFDPAEGQMVGTPAPTLSWRAAQDDRDNPLHYEVRVGNGGGDLLNSWILALSADGTSQVTIARGALPAGQSYVYAVRARDPQGAWSSWSLPQTFFLAATPSVQVGDAAYDTLDQAIAAAPAGATITLGAGLLHLTAPVQLPAGISLVGAGAHHTVLDGTGLAVGVSISASGRTGAAQIRGLTVSNAQVGVQVVDTHDTVLRNVVFYGNAHAGLEVMEGASAQVINATFVHGGTGALAHGTLAVRNSIVTDNQTGFATDGAGTIASRYNDLFANHGINYQGAQAGSGDIVAEISFVAPAHQDFHLRFAEATTDRGDPADDFATEPAPNGGRVNMGAYGNTVEAEESVTAPPSNPSSTAGGGGSAGGCAVAGAPSQSRWALAFLALLALAARRRRATPARARRPRGAAKLAIGVGVVGLLVAAASPAEAAIALVQARGATNAATNSLSVSWGSTTTSGNLLVAAIAVRGGSGTTITPPTGGWTLAKRSDNSNGTVSTAIYYIANAASQSTTAKTWSLSASVNATISVIEYSGVDTSSPLDLTAASSGTGTTATTSSSSTVAQAAELAVGAISAVGTASGVPTFSGLTSTYTQQDATRTSTGSTTATRNTTETYDLEFTGALPAISASLTISSSVDWAGVVVTFKSRAMHWISSGAGIFSANGNWSWSKGGTSNGSNPGSTDDVIFDNGGLGSATTTSAVTVNSLELQSTYTGTVTAGAGGSDRVKTNWDITIGGGTLSAGGGAFRTNLSGSYLGNFVITGGELDGAGAAIQGNDLIMSGGMLLTGSGTITVRGDTIFSGGTISLGGNASFESQSGTYTQTGGTLSTNDNTATFNSAVEVDGGTIQAAANGTLTMKSTLGMNGSSALINVNGGTMTLTSDATLTAGTLEAASAGTMTLNNAVTVNGNNALLDAASGTIAISTNGSNLSVSAGSVKASGGGTITVAHTLTLSGGTVDANTGSISVAQTTTAIAGTIKATSGTVTFSGNVTASGATFDANGGTIDASAAGITFGLSGGTVSGTSGTVKFATLTVSGTGTYDGAGGTTTASALVSVTASGATYKTGSGTSTLSAGVTVSGGTFDATGGTTTVSGAAITVSGGTYKVGTGTTTASAGLTVSSGTLALLSDGGQLKLGSAQTLTISGGTLQSTGTTQSTYPIITSSSGNYTFTISAGTLNLNGLQVQKAAATGMNVSGTAVTFTSFKNVRFTNNAGGATSKHLAIARGALGANFTLNAPGCAFDTTATFNVATTSTGSTFYAYFDQVNGLGGEGDSRDSDGDASPDDGKVDNSATNSSLVLWTFAVETDTAGSATGFPTAAFDWNTFTFYSVYATFSGVAANTDRIYVRSVNGTASYSYDINTSTYGTVVGTPRWDTVNETASFDVNGNGVLSESNIHVLYVTTAGGYIFKLIDSGTALAKPASGIWATEFPTNKPTGSVTVSTITSPVVSDGSNLYFGGTTSGTPALFAVQISSGGTTCNGTTNGRTTQEECAKSYSSVVTPTAVTTALSWETFSSSSYIYFADTAKVYRLNATSGTLQSSFSTSGSVNGSVRTIFSSVFCTDSTGRLNNLYADPSANSGTMGNKSGFPYVASGNPSLSPPYADVYGGFEYFGDANGKVYKVSNTGTASTGYPFSTGLGTISQAPLFLSANNYLIVGDTAGKIAYVDTTGPTLKYTLTVSGSVSAISYNAAANSNAGEIMVSTSTGGLYFLPKTMP